MTRRMEVFRSRWVRGGARGRLMMAVVEGMFCHERNEHAYPREGKADVTFSLTICSKFFPFTATLDPPIPSVIGTTGPTATGAASFFATVGPVCLTSALESTQEKQGTHVECIPG